MENVPQVLTAPEWPSLVGRLEAMGYRNRWAKLDSSRFGSAQKRVRAFMVSRLGQDPPELPLSAPNAPRLCLRDVMEPERPDRYVRRIPLDRVKWRTPKDGYRHPQSEGIECRLMDAGDPRLETRRIASEDSLCPALRTGCPQKAVEEEEEERVRPLVGTADNLRMAPRGRKAIGTVRDGEERLVVAPSDSAGESTPTAEDTRESFYSRRMLYSSSSSPTLRRLHSIRDMVKVVDREPGQSTPVAEVEGVVYYPERSLYSSSSSSSPTVCTDHGNNRIQVVADWQRGGMDQANRLYSSSSSSPAIMCHGGGKRDVKVVAEAEDDLVVSILTPRECWRLMGFPEWAYLRASRVSSETQLYNQAGNSIVVEVLMAIFNSMFRPPKRRVQTTLEAVA
jgi:site-specific DNA-cytosine methylase